VTIKAIETRYAGCRFRSRLEARWALFFDHMGLTWEYEPQGFEVSRRITGGWNNEKTKTFRYLPDFWLPDLHGGIWGEVKGSLTNDETARLYDAAASLSSSDGGGCRDSGGNDVALFGSLTSSVGPANPVLLHIHKGDLEASCLFCGAHTRSVTVACDDGSIHHSATQALLRGFACSTHSTDPLVDLSLAAARSARFEFGARR
jgi:hypothetical protein